MNNFKNVYVTGSIAFDTIMDFPGEFKEYFHPEKLHQLNVSFAVDRLDKQLGGCGTNIAYNIARILNFKFKIFNQSQIFNNKFLKGSQKISIIGSVGKDGKEFLKFFKKNNIGTESMLVDKNLFTSSGSAITDKNDNQIWGFYYGAGEKVPEIDFNKINNKTDLFVISANHKNSFLYFQKNVIKNKIPYLYDPGMALTWITDSDLKEGVLNSTYIAANDYEIAMITKRLRKTVNEITKYGVNVITTLGEKGVEYRNAVIPVKTGIQGNFSLDSRLRGNDNILQIPAFKSSKIVDPTGAGDAWRGGFIAGLLMNYSTEDCLRLGNVMASFAIEKYGTVNHRPTMKEIERRLRSL